MDEWNDVNNGSVRVLADDGEPTGVVYKDEFALVHADKNNVIIGVVVDKSQGEIHGCEMSVDDAINFARYTIAHLTNYINRRGH